VIAKEVQSRQLNVSWMMDTMMNGEFVTKTIDNLCLTAEVGCHHNWYQIEIYQSVFVAIIKLPAGWRFFWFQKEHQN
jgi:hypothetical protein